MFPGAHAVVYRNEAGEPLGWDNPSCDEPEYDPDRFLPAGEDDDDDDLLAACRDQAAGEEEE